MQVDFSHIFGKVMGGGFPAAAFGGRADVMAQLAPSGPVYQAGTLSGNPIATTAGLATLRLATDDVYDRLDKAAAAVCRLVHDALEDSANMVVRLTAELADSGRYPAIDVSRSRTLGEELLVGEDRHRTLENMRGVARSLDPEESWQFLAERAREGS